MTVQQWLDKLHEVDKLATWHASQTHFVFTQETINYHKEAEKLLRNVANECRLAIAWCDGTVNNPFNTPSRLIDE